MSNDQTYRYTLEFTLLKSKIKCPMFNVQCPNLPLYPGGYVIKSNIQYTIYNIQCPMTKLTVLPWSLRY